MKIDKQVKTILNLAFQEDAKDITSLKLLGPKIKIQARIIAKQKGIVCGVKFAEMAFKLADRRCQVKIVRGDGEKISRGDKILTVSGKAIPILSAERKAVNFVQHLSGIATLTSKYVEATKGTKTKILDTRKTIPGTRVLQKYAVRCGGGRNHRMNLSQMAMVKDNHLKALGNDTSNLLKLKSKLPAKTLLEIEAKSMKEVNLALNANADIIMLDNMPISRLKKAVRFIRKQSSCQIEVSGGVQLKDVKRIASLGVERISVGALTHSAPALDASLDVTKSTHE